MASSSALDKKTYSPIKEVGVIDQISQEEFEFRCAETTRCAIDPVYFAKNYYYIRSIDQGTILLPPYPAQEELIDSICNNRKTISLASRQSGKTTAYIAVCLWICFFMEGKEIIILANKEKTAIGILKRIKRAYEWIPREKDWIKPGVTKWSEKQIEFENGCSITAMATSSDAARSNSAYLCVTGDNRIDVKIDGVVFRSIKIEDLYEMTNDCDCDLEVMTDEGWTEFDGVVCNGNRSDIVEINDSLRCTSDHKIFTNKGKKKADECDGLTTKTSDGDDNLMHITSNGLKSNEKVYDLINVKNSKHSFFVNNGKFLISNCVIDEAAFVPIGIMDDLWASIYPVISRSSTSKMVLVSTPNGLGGKFCEIWQSATLGNNAEWNAIFIPWWKVPGRDENWKKKEIAGLGPSGHLIFSAEYDCKFLGSAPTLLSPDVIQELIDNSQNSVHEGKIWEIGDERTGKFKINIFREPEAGHAYILGGDVAEGIGLDASASKVFDITDLFNVEEVASFVSNTIDGPHLGYVFAKMASKYNNAYVACERNGVSISAIDSLWRTFEYDNIVDIGSNKYAIGIFSNHATKLDACLWFRERLKMPDFNLTLHDSETILELQKFERLKSKSMTRYEASAGHDDRVMALIWAIYCIKEEQLNSYYDIVAYLTNSFGVEVPARLRTEVIGLPGKLYSSEAEIEADRKKMMEIPDMKLKMLSSSIDGNGNDASVLKDQTEQEAEYNFFFSDSNSSGTDDDDNW